MMLSRNQELADSFYDFCLLNPDLRFWQALRVWSGQNFVLVAKSIELDIEDHIADGDLQDTFNWEGKDK